MKAEDRLKELIESGEINSLDGAKQEGFIKGWNEALRIHDVAGQSELLFAFITEIKSEFADQNWDYLDFIADRVIGKQ